MTGCIEICFTQVTIATGSLRNEHLQKFFLPHYRDQDLGSLKGPSWIIIMASSTSLWKRFVCRDPEDVEPGVEAHSYNQSTGEADLYQKKAQAT